MQGQAALGRVLGLSEGGKYPTQPPREPEANAGVRSPETGWTSWGGDLSTEGLEDAGRMGETTLRLS